MKNQPRIFDRFILRKKSRRYDVIVVDSVTPQPTNQIKQGSQESELIDFRPIEANSMKIPQAEHSSGLHSFRVSRKRRSSFLALSVVFAIAGWVGSQLQSPTRGMNTNDSAVAKLVERAHQHIHRNSPQLALIDLNMAIRVNPLRAELYLFRARVFEQLGGCGYAKTDCDKALHLCSAERNATEAELTEIKRFREICLKEFPKLDRCVIDSQFLADSIANLSHEIAIQPSAERYNERACLYELRNRPDLALLDFNQAVQLEPNNSHFIHCLASLEQELHKYNEAAAEYSKIVEHPTRFSNVDVCRALSSRAECYTKLNKINFARADEEAANELKVVASGNVGYDKLLPMHYVEKSNRALDSVSRILVQTKSNFIGLLPLTEQCSLTLGVDESIAARAYSESDAASAGTHISNSAIPCGNNTTIDAFTDAELQNLTLVADCESLDLSGSAVTDTGLKALAGKKLKRLDLDGTKITAAGIRNLGPQSELTSLSLECDACINDAAIKDLHQFPKLTFLNLRRTTVTDNGIKLLPETAPNLKNLYLREDDIGDDSIPAIAQLGSLVYLELSYNDKIKGKTLEKLGALKDLRYLNLGYDGSLQQRYLLQLLQRRPTLFELYLTMDEVGDNAAPSIASIKALRTLDITGTGVTETGYRMIARSKTLREIATGFDYFDDCYVAQFKDSLNNKLIKIGPRSILPETEWPMVIDEKET